MANISRRNMLKAGLLTPAVIACADINDVYSKEKTSTVYMTKDLSPKGLKKIYSYINKNITGKVAIKLHTGEPKGPNIIPPAWVKEFLTVIPNSTIVECNVLYQSPRQTTEGHLETLKTNGWTDFATVDIMDADGEINLPVKGGRHFKQIAFGKNILNYDSMVVLTHFKGHSMGGFGGSLKNIAIGCASGKTGKSQLHEGMWGASGAKFMENMVEGGKAVIDHFGKNIVYINVMRNMSVDCDCAGTYAAAPTIPDYGILASTDILAIDKASVDIIYNLKNNQGKDLIERIESRNGLRQLSYMKEMQMGSDNYRIVEI